MKCDELPFDYVDTINDVGAFLEGVSVLLWALESFLREEKQNDVAESLRFLAFGCRDRGNQIAEFKKQMKKTASSLR